jgi:hypothetical protein
VNETLLELARSIGRLWAQQWLKTQETQSRASTTSKDATTRADGKSICEQVRQVDVKHEPNILDNRSDNEGG